MAIMSALTKKLDDDRISSADAKVLGQKLSLVIKTNFVESFKNHGQSTPQN